MSQDIISFEIFSDKNRVTSFLDLVSSIGNSLLIL